MSMMDEFRALAVTLMDEFAVGARLERIVNDYDPRTDTASRSQTVISCKAILTPRRVSADDGRIVVDTSAKLNVQPQIGDRLIVGTATYLVETVEEVAPDGETPMIYMAGLKT